MQWMELSHAVKKEMGLIPATFKRFSTLEHKVVISKIDPEVIMALSYIFM